MVLEDLLVELEDANVYDKIRFLKACIKNKDSRRPSRLEIAVDSSVYWDFIHTSEQVLNKQEIG